MTPFYRQEETLLFLISLLFVMVIVLIWVMIHMFFYHTARIYNWNGPRYCYLGYVPIRREDGELTVRLTEHMTDLSHTTLYRICPGRAFCRKNRYKNLFVYADGDRRYVVVDDSNKEEMKTEIPF